MQDELLPCPFCGGADIQSFRHRGTAYMHESWHVECTAEQCGNGTCHHETEAEAIAAWNTRAPQPVADQQCCDSAGRCTYACEYEAQPDRTAAQEIERLKKEQDALLDALFDAVALIGHAMPMDTTALIGGEKMSAIDVWQKGYDLMFPRKQLIKDATDAK